MTERRRSRRFRVEEGIFAVFSRYDGVPIIGKIVDISAGGLCVTYLSSNELGRGPYSVRVFASEHMPAHLERMRCTVIHDSELEDGWSDLLSRRCGVGFDRLMDDSLLKWRRFVKELRELF